MRHGGVGPARVPDHPFYFRTLRVRRGWHRAPHRAAPACERENHHDRDHRPSADGELRRIPVADITAEDGFNPRSSFDRRELEALAASVAQHGVLTPITVGPHNGSCYPLVAGERRLLAARDSGLAEIPAVVRYVDDHTAGLDLALLENIARADLTPLDEARAFAISGLAHREHEHCSLGAAPGATAAGGSSAASRGKRASSSKNFSISANPSRVAPVLFAKRSRSLSSSVQHAISSSASHSRRIAQACRRPQPTDHPQQRTHPLAAWTSSASATAPAARSR